MRNRPYGFEIYLVNVKTIRTITQIFVAFSEKLNFNVVVPRYCSSSPLALRLPTSGPVAASSPAASSSAASSQLQPASKATYELDGQRKGRP